MSEAPERKSEFDSARGLAATLVVICHCIAAFAPEATFGVAGSRTTSIWHWPPFSIVHAGSAAVVFFFVLSGYVLSGNALLKPARPAASHWRLHLAMALKRPLRLGGLVWFSSALALVLWQQGALHHQPAAALSGSTWLAGFWATAPSAMEFLRDVAVDPFAGMARYNPPLWTIATELYGSLLIFGVLALLRFVSSLTTKRWLLLIGGFAGLRWPYGCFVLGMLIALEHQSPHFLRRVRGDWLLAVGLLLAAYPAYLLPELRRWPNLPFIWSGWPVLGALMLVHYLGQLGPLGTRVMHNPVALWLGEQSYAIYALHFLVIGSIGSAIYVALAAAGWSLTTAGWVASTTILAVTLCLAPAVTRLVDQPITYVANRLGRWIAGPGRPQRQQVSPADR